MTNRTVPWLRMAGLAALAALGAGCHGILDVQNPGKIADADLNTPDAVPGLVEGMSNRMANLMAASGDNMVIWVGLVTDEFKHGGSYSWSEVPAGVVVPEDMGGNWGAAHVARWVAEAGIRRMQDTSVFNNPADFAKSPYVSRAYLFAAIANRVLGENMCTAVFDGGSAESSTAYFTRATGQADSAIAIGAAAGSGASSYVSAAYGVRASLKAWAGDWAGAVADAQMVGASFVYNSVTQLPSPDNDTWFETHSRNEYSIYDTYMSDSLRAVSEDMDGPAWKSTHLADPRAPWKILKNADGSVKKGANGSTPAYQQNKYATQTSPVPLVKGTEMLVLRAEAALRAATPDTASAYALMNQARAVYGLPALATAPDLATAWKDLHYERAATVWLEGRHLWDASRWYNESGPMHSEAMAGRDQCLPVSLSEINSNANLADYRATLTHPLHHQ